MSKPSILQNSYIILSWGQLLQIRYESAYSSIAGIRAGVPQGRIFSPVLFHIYTSDQPNTLVSDFVDDKTII